MHVIFLTKELVVMYSAEVTANNKASIQDPKGKIPKLINDADTAEAAIQRYS